MSVTNKKFGGLGAFGRFLEKLRDVFLPYSGGELTGNIYTTPYYDSSIQNPEGGQTLIVSKGKVAKGTNPPQTEWHTMVMAVDNTGSTNNSHKYGQIETYVSTSGTVTTNMTTYRDTAGSAASATIGISITSAGAVSATAPTPAVTARGTNIATAGFVDTYNDTYVITEQEILALWQ